MAPKCGRWSHLPLRPPPLQILTLGVPVRRLPLPPGPFCSSEKGVYLVIYFLFRFNGLAWCTYVMLVAQGLAQVMEILSINTHKVPQLTSCTQGVRQFRTTNHDGWHGLNTVHLFQNESATQSRFQFNACPSNPQAKSVRGTPMDMNMCPGGGVEGGGSSNLGSLAPV